MNCFGRRLWVAVMLPVFVIFTVPGLPALSAAGSPAPAEKDGPLAKARGGLADLYREYSTFRGRPAPPLQGESFSAANPFVRVDEGERVVIDAVAEGSAEELLTALEALGLAGGTVYGSVVSGLLPLPAIPEAAALPQLRFARPAMWTTNAGTAPDQADPALRAQEARSAYGIDGAGMTVGTLSNSYDCFGANGISPDAADDVLSGDLPAGVSVLKEFVTTDCATQGTDEGRAMMQLVHDLAPGASQSFYTASYGQADFAQGIIDLAAAGADIVVDDAIYFAEPMFQDGIVAQAADTVRGTGTAYFSAAGDSARESLESPYAGGTDPVFSLPAHDFNGGAGTDYFQSITIPTLGIFTLVLQWDSPYASATGLGGSTTDLDICILDDPPTTAYVCAQDANEGGDPIEILSWQNTRTPSETAFNLYIYNWGSADHGAPDPSLVKYVLFSDGGGSINEHTTSSGTVYGHAAAAGARAVGAARWLETPAYGQSPPLLEPYSSPGPMTILFDLSDNPVTDVRAKPEIVSVDGTNTTFFGSDSAADADAWPNYYGTSAAAPHAAAVAALLRERFPSMVPDEIYRVMENTAIDMGPPGFDDDSGMGLIDALAAAGCALEGNDDWNGDGSPDLAWRHVPSGMGYLWHLDELAFMSASPLGTVDPAWAMAGTADMNRDGMQDIIWRNSVTGVNLVWYLNGNLFTGSAALPAVSDLNWSVAAVADFNNDGNVDIFWRNGVTGANYLWYLTGTSVTGAEPVAAAGIGWSVAGVGDFNADGDPDLLWRNSATGVNYLWYLDGAEVSGVEQTAGADPLWLIVQVSDFSGDCLPDILWRHGTTGLLYLWKMDGATVLSGQAGPSAPAGWMIVD